MITILWALLSIYLVMLAARAILSWFPARPDSPLTPIRTVLTDLTEPVLRPVRRVIPPIGMFDISFMIVFFVLFLLWQALDRAR